MPFESLCGQGGLLAAFSRLIGQLGHERWTCCQSGVASGNTKKHCVKLNFNEGESADAIEDGITPRRNACLGAVCSERVGELTWGALDK